MEWLIRRLDGTREQVELFQSQVKAQAFEAEQSKQALNDAVHELEVRTGNRSKCIHLYAYCIDHGEAFLLMSGILCETASKLNFVFPYPFFHADMVWTYTRQEFHCKLRRGVATHCCFQTLLKFKTWAWIHGPSSGL